MNFADIKLISFDCYGTLIDWEAGILSALKPILTRHNVRLADREILLHYAGIESTLQKGAYRTYREILREVVRQFGVELNFTPAPAELDCLSDSLAQWQPFPEIVSALQALKRHYQLAIISNIDDDLLAATIRHLNVPFDFLITAQQVHSYKPSPPHFQELMRRTGLPPQQILHVAESIYHDIIPARALGLRTSWVHRLNRLSITGTLGATASPDLEVPDLTTLVDRV